MNQDRISAGFSKGVSEYLGVAVALADAKATAFLAAALTLGAALIQLRDATGMAFAARIIAALFLAACVAANAFVIAPRLPSGRRGLIFWEDIRTRRQVEDYAAEVAGLTDSQVELEYAAQNYFISEVLHMKHVWVRRGIVLFLISLGFTAAAYLL